MHLNVVSHAWKYHRLLTYHLSAFLLYPSARTPTTVTIFHAPRADDPATSATLDFFREQPRPASLAWDFRELPIPQLCRRAIGRNMAALTCPPSVDAVLFSDVDYIFAAGPDGTPAIDAAAAALTAAWTSGPKICFPRELMSSIDHACGDAEITRVEKPGVYEMTPDRYQATKLDRAIGGAQWVPGDFARERGYLNGIKKWHRPAATWKRTFEDRSWRGWTGLESVAVDVPGLHRIRHGLRGRTNIGCTN